MYEVFVSHEAEKYYKRQDKSTKKKINRCIENLTKEPLSGSHVRRLHGRLAGRYRYALGGLRVVYEVDTRDRTVKILSIKGRGDIYK